jgi:hypothetical protein
MTRRSLVVRIAIVIAAVAAFYAVVLWKPTFQVRDHFSSNEPGALKVLFIGNSLTFQNDLAAMVGELVRGADPGRPLAITHVAAPGVSLADHLKDGTAARTIARAPWDYVVLQERTATPIEDPAMFESSVRKLDAQIRAHGAKTLLYEVWPRLGQQDPRELHDTFARVATAVNVTLVPVAVAWRRALAANPKLALYQPDGYHATRLGAYLAACVFYGVLTGRSPDHLAPLGLPTDRVTELQRYAGTYGASAPSGP